MKIFKKYYLNNVGKVTLSNAEIRSHFALDLCTHNAIPGYTLLL